MSDMRRDDGPQGSLEDFFRQNRDRLEFYIGGSVLGDPHSTEDICQIVWHDFAGRWGQYKDRESPYNILLVIANHKIVDWYRSRARRRAMEVYPGDDVVGQLADRSVFLSQAAHTFCAPAEVVEKVDVARAVESLPSCQSEAVWRRYFDDLTMRVVADNMEISVNGAKKNVSAGKRALRHSRELDGYSGVHGRRDEGSI